MKTKYLGDYIGESKFREVLKYFVLVKSTEISIGCI